MFKVGDKVRAVRDFMGVTEGKVYTVREDLYVIDDAGDDVPVDWNEPIFELVTEGPIRTVTHREIVPGVYGRVEVSDNGGNGVAIQFVRRDNLKDFGVKAVMTAEELREAAHLFNQLAEVLEDA